MTQRANGILIALISIGVGLAVGLLARGLHLQSVEKDGLPPASNVANEIAKLISDAEKLSANREYREAEILLTRAIQTDTDSLKAWRALAAVQREIAKSSLESKQHILAAQSVDRAKTSVNIMRSLSINPAVKEIDPKIPLDEERANDALAEKVRQDIDSVCVESIGNALKSADDAVHSYWNILALGFRDVKTDRKKVVEGLIHLKPVFQLGPWASESTRRNANEAFAKFKALVTPEEWNDILLRAGFDPVSRDALKKAGLE